jgi:hypothetical protein
MNRYKILIWGYNNEAGMGMKSWIEVWDGSDRQQLDQKINKLTRANIKASWYEDGVLIGRNFEGQPDSEDTIEFCPHCGKKLTCNRQ